MRKFHDIQSSRIFVAQRSLELVTLAEAKNHLKESADDKATENYIEQTIVAARKATEAYCNRSFVLQDHQLTMDALPSGRNEIYLPRSPVVEITGFTYLDCAGDSQELTADDFVLDSNSLPGRLVPALGKCWPSTPYLPGAVTIEYTAGIYKEGAEPVDISSEVPADLRHAQYLLIQHLYDQRAILNIGNIVNTLPWSIESLLSDYIIAGV